MTTENLSIQFNLPRTYHSYIKNAVGAKLFRDVWASAANRTDNITGNGERSCAVFVSNILMIFKLIGSCHATVTSTVDDIVKSGWYSINKPRKGCILVWEEKEVGEHMHMHIGFYIGNSMAISNSTSKRVPVVHHWTLGTRSGKPVRKVVAMYWNDKLTWQSVDFSSQFQI